MSGIVTLCSETAVSRNDAKWAQAVRLRGEVLNSFGQIELAVVGALLWAAAPPNRQGTAIPSLSSERLKALRRILAAGEALAERSSAIGPLLDQLEDFRELRNFLAHGMLRIPDLSDTPALRDRAMIEFHFIRTDRRTVASRHYFFDLDDYESLLAELAELADRLTAALPFFNPSLPDASVVV